MNLFLLDSDDVFIDLLTDSGTGSITQHMQAAMLRGDEAYSGSRSYYALDNAVKEIFGHLQAVYDIARKYDMPVITDSARFAENAYFIQQREQGYHGWMIEEITRGSCKYADGLAMSAKKDAMVQVEGCCVLKMTAAGCLYRVPHALRGAGRIPHLWRPERWCHGASGR